VAGVYTLTYNVQDPAGNPATPTNRVVRVVGAPSISDFTQSLVLTNPDTGTVTAQVGASINPNGLATTAYFRYGLSTAYSVVTGSTNLPNVYLASTVAALVPNLSRGVAYHWSVIASNSAGASIGPDRIMAVPSLFAAGDLNGDGIVSADEINAAYSNYLANSPWLFLTNVAGLGGTNVTFALSNALTGVFSVQYSTDLVNWQYLGPADPRYLFTDTNAPSTPKRYYRLSYP
jgi:hypothetical protein